MKVIDSVAMKLIDKVAMKLRLVDCEGIAMFTMAFAMMGRKETRVLDYCIMSTSI